MVDCWADHSIGSPVYPRVFVGDIWDVGSAYGRIPTGKSRTRDAGRPESASAGREGTMMRQNKLPRYTARWEQQPVAVAQRW